MRIPLDYYRILSVPIKATPEQLEQAKSDRLLQQPRREYSKQAIQARRELIEHSYQILSTPESRAVYDAEFLVNMQPMATAVPPEISQTAETEKTVEDVTFASPNPTIEIPSSHLVGALLILHELGEYELVLRIAIDYFNSQETNRRLSPDKTSGNPIEENIILSLALAYLELGQEQWHRQEYENAAVSWQMGINLLEREDLFPQVKEELESYLYQLRPYRVLELISRNSVKSSKRAKGFQLLREMLAQRQGIEGKGEDRSGLSFDQFLCFIQQLRTYLTSAEQQQLFDSEAQSDSAIASYLAVYALLGRGFGLKRPKLILRAQRKLDGLAEKQDVSWEQAISALLLGHTEKAIYKLKTSQDTTKLKLVQQHSPNSTDLLPGLCFYSEQWLRQDVLSQFPDLATTNLTLKEYFGDRQVQAYLEELPLPVVTKARASSTLPSAKPTTKVDRQSQVSRTKIMSFWRNLFSTEKATLVKAISSGSTANLEKELVAVGRNSSNNSRNATIGGRNSISPTRNTRNKNLTIAKGKSLSLPLQANRKTVPASVTRTKGIKKRTRRRKLKTATLWKGWLFILGLIIGPGTIVFITTKLLLYPATERANEAQLTVAVSQPAIKLPPPERENPVAAKPKLTLAEKSQQVIQTWLDSKSAAFGKQHQIARLNNILAEPLLGIWRDRATAYQQGNSYRDYEHRLKLRSAEIDPSNPNKAIVEAEVKEIAQHYQSGQLDNSQSYNDDLLVRYQLIRQGEKWLIKKSEVLKTL